MAGTSDGLGDTNVTERERLDRALFSILAEIDDDQADGVLASPEETVRQLADRVSAEPGIRRDLERLAARLVPDLGTPAACRPARAELDALAAYDDPAHQVLSPSAREHLDTCEACSMLWEMMHADPEDPLLPADLDAELARRLGAIRSSEEPSAPPSGGQVIDLAEALRARWPDFEIRPIPLFPPTLAVAAAGNEPTALPTTIPGLRAEIRWPSEDDARVRLAFIIADNVALGVESTSDVRVTVGVTSEPPDLQIPWEAWVRLGHDSPEPVVTPLGAEIALTGFGTSLDDARARQLVDWVGAAVSPYVGLTRRPTH